MAAPRILKVSLNSGIGKYLKEKDAIDEIAENLKKISGQKPVFAKSKNQLPVSRFEKVKRLEFL